MRTGGMLAPVRGGSMKVARKPRSVGHFLGFLAVAAFPSALSTRAYARSPSRPRSVTSLALSSSPSIDLTGYRHSEATEPWVALGMSSSSTYRAQYAPNTADTPDIPVRLTWLGHGTQRSRDLGAFVRGPTLALRHLQPVLLSKAQNHLDRDLCCSIDSVSLPVRQRGSRRLSRRDYDG